MYSSSSSRHFYPTSISTRTCHIPELQDNLQIFGFKIPDKLTGPQKVALLKVLYKNKDAFSLGDELGYTNAVRHHIDTGDHPPIQVPLRKYTLDELQAQWEMIQDMLAKNLIEPSNSPWSSPMLLVKKPPDANGKVAWRCVIDYRALNNVTVKDAFPLPNIQDMFDSLQGSHYFSTLAGLWL